MIFLRISLEGNISNEWLLCNSHRYCRDSLEKKPSGQNENNA